MTSETDRWTNIDITEDTMANKNAKCMTWGEFKTAVEALGLKDDSELWYIDVTSPTQDDFDNGTIEVYQETEGDWAIG